MDFNKNRFANFARYDLTINKTFFRNIAFVTLAGAIGIAMLGFMLRYDIYRDVVTNYAEWGGAPSPSDFSHYTHNYITTFYLLGFTALMMAIFAGCWAHNLRNKQGRITELTLPANNLEKFTWHALLTLVGGFLLCIVSLLLADGLNALLTLLMFGAENGVGSLTRSAFEVFTFTMTSNDLINLPSISTNGDMGTEDIAAVNFIRSISFLIITSAIAETLCFFFGNAVKYKYNIILTYIALQILGTILSVGFFIFTAASADTAFGALAEVDADGEDVANFFTYSFYAIGSVAILLSAALIWKSYHLYTRAQITSALNK